MLMIFFPYNDIIVFSYTLKSDVKNDLGLSIVRGHAKPVSPKSREKLPTVAPKQYIHRGFCKATTVDRSDGDA